MPDDRGDFDLVTRLKSKLPEGLLPRHRLVDVYVLLAPSDTYTVIVRKRNTHEVVTLYRVEGVYADSLADIIRNLSTEV